MSAGKRGLKRVEDTKKELERIKKKIEIAQELNPDIDLGQVDDRIARLDDLIAEGAKEEARREAINLEKEARRLRDGKKKPGGNHPGNDCDEPDDKDDDDDDDDDGGNGNGGDGNGGGGSSKCCCCCSSAPAAPASGSGVPDATCVYLQTRTTVAAWNRGGQRWEVFDAKSEIIKVTFITGGILAIGKDKGALFDCKLGTWLKAFDPAENLVDGDGQ
ncbi:hypothetical protein JCM17845_12400 [Iodidimonas gelatinilytica]|uniref:Uncharacterized protein n=1 Tax=Iodidimonas gelatinilytica TaxID=1236966 RepID=A0A5A7MXM1_9PROT|nr:hypothetical protein [Iodidimonas gelatinilytica]GER00617.1 hypothetical protein JCM17845_12400 [Iodidimonas gelatinilytica]